jgi:hypothetical protein
MPKEVPLQASLFTGDLVDTRTTKQKKAAEEQEKPKQAEMFSQRELGQFGVNPHPQIPLSPKTHIELALQDMRTDEEKERDFQQEVESRSLRLFGGEAEDAKTTGPQLVGSEAKDAAQAVPKTGE